MAPARPSGNLSMEWEIVIGLEVHAQLSTASKIFSGASTQFGAAPNAQACAVDIALPGVLPVFNKGALERAIRFGLAVNGNSADNINRRSIFARKNYFYPDLPKGYQISQYEQPIVLGGTISIVLEGGEKSIRLTRAHLEEDAGKSLHQDFHGMSGIDLNRAGTPLLEIVSEPDMRSAEEAVAYARALHSLVRWIDICDGNMQEGSFRCDANVSVRPRGSDNLGTRREIKNLNSFRSCSRRSNTKPDGRSRRFKTAGPSRRLPCCSTRTPAKPAPCARRRMRTITVISPTRICCPWSFPKKWSRKSGGPCRNCRSSEGSVT